MAGRTFPFSFATFAYFAVELGFDSVLCGEISPKSKKERQVLLSFSSVWINCC